MVMPVFHTIVNTVLLAYVGDENALSLAQNDGGTAYLTCAGRDPLSGVTTYFLLRELHCTIHTVKLIIFPLSPTAILETVYQTDRTSHRSQ